MSFISLDASPGNDLFDTGNVKACWGKDGRGRRLSQRAMEQEVKTVEVKAQPNGRGLVMGSAHKTKTSQHESLPPKVSVLICKVVVPDIQL